MNLSLIASIGSFIAPANAASVVAGTSGPYNVVVKSAVKYASPAKDTAIECKPVAKAGHFAGPFPAVVLIHGGGWTGGTSAVGPGYTGYSGSWCTLWASWGFDAFSIDYRSTYQVKWPAQIVDVQAAIRWLRAHAKSLNINPGMIVANGDSAGGQLAMIAGYTNAILPGDLATNYNWVSSRPQLVVSQFGPWTFGPSRSASAPSTRAEDYARQILLDSADGRTTATTPNTLFLQGTKDTTVNQCTQSEPAFRYLKSNGRPAAYLAYPGGHEFTGMGGATWSSVVGGLQVKTISFAYHRAHIDGVLPASEAGPSTSYSDASLPSGCP